MTNARQGGLTFIEILLIVAVGSMVLVALFSLAIRVLGVSRTQVEQSRIVADAKVEMERMSDIIRNARNVDFDDDGDFSGGSERWIQAAGVNEIIIYSNADTDDESEIVRYWLNGDDLMRGVTELDVGAVEATEILARSFRNLSQNQNLFKYYSVGGVGAIEIEEDNLDVIDLAVIDRVGITFVVDSNETQLPGAAVIDTIATPRRGRLADTEVVVTPTPTPTPTATPTITPTASPTITPTPTPSPPEVRAVCVKEGGATEGDPGDDCWYNCKFELNKVWDVALNMCLWPSFGSGGGCSHHGTEGCQTSSCPGTDWPEGEGNASIILPGDTESSEFTIDWICDDIPERAWCVPQPPNFFDWKNYEKWHSHWAFLGPAPWDGAENTWSCPPGDIQDGYMGGWNWLIDDDDQEMFLSVDDVGPVSEGDVDGTVTMTFTVRIHDGNDGFVEHPAMDFAAQTNQGTAQEEGEYDVPAEPGDDYIGVNWDYIVFEPNDSGTFTVDVDIVSDTLVEPLQYEYFEVCIHAIPTDLNASSAVTMQKQCGTGWIEDDD